jgi:CheY-like chemotaxis protein/HPt (histidine-containing phosphotransfer) domain-containing protein
VPFGVTSLPVATDSATASEASSRALRILLAEDNPVNQRLAVVLLEKRGHAVTVVPTGLEAVRAVQRTRFDVVLMDVQMPEMDGLEATRRIREVERETGHHVPIVAMTAYALKGDRERCLESGMDEYLSKPIQTRELFAALSRVGLRREVVDLPKPTLEPLTWPTGPDDFDESAALKHVGGDRRLLRDLIDLFITDSGRWLAEIRVAVQGGDTEAVRRYAHNLKGALVHFELRSAILAAQMLEFLGRDANLDDAGRACQVLERELTRVRPQLEQFRVE